MLCVLITLSDSCEIQHLSGTCGDVLAGQPHSFVHYDSSSLSSSIYRSCNCAAAAGPQNALASWPETGRALMQTPRFFVPYVLPSLAATPQKPSASCLIIMMAHGTCTRDGKKRRDATHNGISWASGYTSSLRPTLSNCEFLFMHQSMSGSSKGPHISWPGPHAARSGVATFPSPCRQANPSPP